eukprot:365939-Chlamydomonas_euryale.AAC.6
MEQSAAQCSVVKPNSFLVSIDLIMGLVGRWTCGNHHKHAGLMMKGISLELRMQEHMHVNDACMHVGLNAWEHAHVRARLHAWMCGCMGRCLSSTCLSACAVRRVCSMLPASRQLDTHW